MSEIQCQRCLQHVPYDPIRRGAHACIPTDGWKALEDEAARYRKALTQIALKECRCIGDCGCKIDPIIFRIANRALNFDEDESDEQ